jgi:hypothetical protein
VSASPSTAAACASSSAPEPRFGRFLERSFALLRAARPDIYAECCRRLAPRRVRLRVDGRVLHLRFSAAEAVFGDDAPRDTRVAIDVDTTTAAILQVIDAEASLLDAVLDGRLELRGGVDDLLAFHDGLMTYVHGAVRAPSFPRLLRDFRALGVLPHQ